MKVLAIIPARGGSKRIPRKNIKDFLGKPILSYPVSAALQSNIFSEVMVSTDDDEIAQIAVESGAAVPSRRSAQNADDHSTTADVLSEVLAYYQTENVVFEYVCCIYPTAPFVTADKLQAAFEILRSESKDVVIPVLPYEHPIQRALAIDEGKLNMLRPENVSVRSQDLEHRYHDSGQFYFFKVSSFLEQKTLWMKNAGAIILSHLDAHDIDNPADWKMAELKYKFRTEG